MLFVTKTFTRRESISRFTRKTTKSDFVWVTSQKQLFQHGLSGSIWFRGGNSTPQQSILGPTLAQDLPLVIIANKSSSNIPENGSENTLKKFRK